MTRYLSTFSRVRRAGLVPALLGAALLASACAGGGAGNRVEVQAGEYFFNPNNVVVPAGESVHAVRNTGTLDHNYVIEENGTNRILGQITQISPGRTEELRITLNAGSYRLVCTLPGHAEAGMVGTVTAR